MDKKRIAKLRESLEKNVLALETFTDYRQKVFEQRSVTWQGSDSATEYLEYTDACVDLLEALMVASARAGELADLA